MPIARRTRRRPASERSDMRAARTVARAAPRDERGEALPAAILFLGVFFTILLGVHVLVVSMARTAVQAAADSGLAAAQVAGPLDASGDCDGDPSDTDSVRECEGILAARIALAGAKNSVVETRLPAVLVEAERGTVTVLAFGGTISPIFGGVEFTVQACGPLDDVPALELTAGSTNLWRC